MAKKVTLQQLQERRDKIDGLIVDLRQILDIHKSQVAKIDKKRFSDSGYRDEVRKVEAETEKSINRIDKALFDALGDSFDSRGAWTREHTLATARFVAPYEGVPGTGDAAQRAVSFEILEELRRSRAERRAAQLSPEALAAETAIAGETGDIATVAVNLDAARLRGLDALARYRVEEASKKLELPDVVEAQGAYEDIDALLKESLGLAKLWRTPSDTDAQLQEQLGRFNRGKRAEAHVKFVKENSHLPADAKLDDAARKAKWQWQRGPVMPQPPKAQEPAPKVDGAKKATPVIPLEREKPGAIVPEVVPPVLPPAA